MLDHIGTAGRLKGNHLRHHVKRGILKPGCPLCVEAGGPVATPEPVVEPLIVATPPPEQPKPASFQRPGIDPLSEAKRQRWRDDVWGYAGNDLEASLAAKLLGCSQEFFHSEIQALFSMSWADVCELAMIQALSDLQSSAIRAARKGDFRGAVLLQKERLLPLFEFAKDRSRQGDKLKSLTNEDLIAKFQKLVEKQGFKVPLISAGTLELREPEPSELEQVSGGGVLGGESKQVAGKDLSSVIGSRQLDQGEQRGNTESPSDLDVPPPPKVSSKQVETVNAASSESGSPVNQPTPPSPIRPSEALRISQAPAIAMVDQSWGLVDGSRQYSR